MVLFDSGARCDAYSSSSDCRFGPAFFSADPQTPCKLIGSAPAWSKAIALIGPSVMTIVLSISLAMSRVFGGIHGKLSLPTGAMNFSFLKAGRGLAETKLQG